MAVAISPPSGSAGLRMPPPTCQLLDAELLEGAEGFFVTVSRSVSFLGRAVPADALVGEATVVRAGRRHLLVEARPVRETDGGEVASALFEALAPFGRLVSFGVASGAPLIVPSHAMMKRAVTVSGFHLDAVMAVPGRFAATLERLYVLVASGALVPHVGLEAPLAHAAEVHAPMESRATLGKLVLSVRAGTGNDAARSTRGAE